MTDLADTEEFALNRVLMQPNSCGVSANQARAVIRASGLLDLIQVQRVLRADLDERERKREEAFQDERRLRESRERKRRARHDALTAAAKPALALLSCEWDDVDDEDKEDWLAIVEALREALRTAGGRE